MRVKACLASGVLGAAHASLAVRVREAGTVQHLIDDDASVYGKQMRFGEPFGLALSTRCKEVSTEYREDSCGSVHGMPLGKHTLEVRSSIVGHRAPAPISAVFEADCDLTRTPQVRILGAGAQPAPSKCGQRMCSLPARMTRRLHSMPMAKPSAPRLVLRQLAAQLAPGELWVAGLNGALRKFVD